MKFNLLFTLILIATIIIGSIYYDSKINYLQDQLSTITEKTDTVKVVLTIHDTTFVSTADTVIQNSDTTIIGDTVYVNHFPYLINTTDQPLFRLKVSVDTRQQTFKYEYKYNPLSINITFTDKYDLRKNMKITTTPDIGTIKIGFDGYTPIKKKFGLSLSGGVYIISSEPGLMLGLSFKKNEFGITISNGQKGYYFRRVIFEF